MEGMSALRQERIGSGYQSRQNDADRKPSHQSLRRSKRSGEKRNGTDTDNSAHDDGAVDGDTKLDRNIAVI